jgi:hypothetical protein
VIDRGGLVRALQRRAVADWVIVEREQALAAIDEAAPGRTRRERRTRWTLIVHDDTPTGRGTARLELGSLDGDADSMVEQTLELAGDTVGETWTSAAPAAPAKVALIDPVLATGDLLDAGTAWLRGISRPADAGMAAISLALTREQVAVQTRQGFQLKWTASLVHATALVIVNEHSIALHRDARRLDDLDLVASLVAATADAKLLANAGAPIAGPCNLRLGPDALIPSTDRENELGIWAAFAAQADGVIERQGLTRYRPGVAIVPGADQRPEPLTIISDGALDFGLASAPVGDEADAVRRFAIVDNGIGGSVGLSPREAAYRRADPNGGVRNLVVTGGTWSGDPTAADSRGAAGTARVIDVRRVRSLAIDPYTGDASLEIALGIDYGTGTARPFVGGTLRLDLLAALATAKRSNNVLKRGAYVGPDAVLVDGAQLLA